VTEREVNACSAVQFPRPRHEPVESVAGCSAMLQPLCDETLRCAPLQAAAARFRRCYADLDVCRRDMAQGENQTSTTSGGSAGWRSDRTRSVGSWA
jgi:hypothetical protein